MKIFYVISRYNFLRDIWEQVYETESRTLAIVKLRQFRTAFPYTNYRLREEGVLVG